MKAAIVTGVSRGLGEALAVALLAEHFVVIGVGRSMSAALSGANYRFVTCDLSQPAAIATLVEPAFADLAAAKPAAVTLINNAAVAWPVGIIGRLNMEEAQTAFATNIAAPLALCNAFLRAFPADTQSRRIINI